MGVREALLNQGKEIGIKKGKEIGIKKGEKIGIKESNKPLKGDNLFRFHDRLFERCK
jgi:hypothetical protein